MAEHMDQFCENLRVKLSGIDNSMKALKAKIDTNLQAAEQDARNQLENVKKRIEQERPKVTAAQASIRKWVEETKATTDKKIAEWIANNEKARLQTWADTAEGYATAAAVVAQVALDEAQQAALEAWLARKDADRAKGTKAA